MTGLGIEAGRLLLFYAFTLAPLFALLFAAAASLRIIYRLGEKWLLLLVVVMVMMIQHQILEGLEFLRTGGASLALVQESFETAANLILAGSTYYALSFAREERRLAEELEESRNRYNRLVENAPSPILVVKDGRIDYANPMATDFFDVASPEALDGADLLEFVHPDDRQRTRRELEDAMDRGHPIALSETRFLADERHRRATSMVAPITYGSEDALQIVLEDVTEREEYQRQLDTTLRNTNDAIFIVDPEADEILECNQRACEIVGYDRDELIGLPASEIHPDEMDRLREFTRAAATDGGARTEDLSCRRRDGREVPAEISGATIEFRGRTCLLAVVRDISERKRRERRLNVLNRVLRHNLRNELNVVIGNADVLEDRIDDPELAEFAGVVKRTASELMSISDELRRVQEAIGREKDLAELETDASDVLERVAAGFRGEYPDADLEVDVPDEAPVRASESLAIAFEQVIENAIVHNDDPAPTVRIGTREGIPEEGWIEFGVIDDGPGMPKQERAIFVEGDEITPLQHGSGIGLWTAVWIVEAFEGEVAIEDADGGGTEVRFRLKRATADVGGTAR